MLVVVGFGVIEMGVVFLICYVGDIFVVDIFY